jgi:pimeloyl-[acyl-carrier protein] methyl ester esterase
MTLHVESLGAGAPLVLLHGWGFHSSIWLEFASGLARRYRVQLVDLPGHGHSRACHFGALDALADQIAARIEDGTLVCGWSLGGIVAQRLARRSPSKARALALIGTTPCFVERKEWKHGIAAETLDAFARGLHDDPPGALDRFVRLNAVDTPGARATVRSMSRRLAERPHASEQALDAGLAMLHATDLRDECSTIAAKTVVIHGSLDRVVPVGAGRWLARTMRHARLAELPRSAHLPFVTDRDAAIDAVSSLDD